MLHFVPKLVKLVLISGFLFAIFQVLALQNFKRILMFRDRAMKDTFESLRRKSAGFCAPSFESPLRPFKGVKEKMVRWCWVWPGWTALEAGSALELELSAPV